MTSTFKQTVHGRPRFATHVGLGLLLLTCVFVIFMHAARVSAQTSTAKAAPTAEPTPYASDYQPWRR